ncbi:UDP-glucose 4-epimerase GalE [Candidatus Woesearchaeota archaeon]|jgi:UDP-glucose 4-epimerase|nr:UDP-glucose 4-epimerase GalE [Candidatus Woesearchaeota archaeon]|tara:strand:- start:2895 stop:3836 length:942 start_codon:yes stop_codon:yes gene_type:complete
MKSILVTGGAGYIGSATVKKLIDDEHKVIVIDNLSKGKKELVDEKAKFLKGDLIDYEFLKKVFSQNEFDAVIHFASYKAVEESMDNPEKYSDNIIGTINLLNIMNKFNVKKLIFSSSAAVYGEPEYVPVDEEHSTNPMSFYGFTKLECENIINWYSELKKMVCINLRYFNVAGDAGLNYLDPDPKNVLPIILEGLKDEKEFTIFGNDYDTRDGTCLRDYIDINDLVQAHISALNLNKSETINLGTSEGTSVLELVNAVEEVLGKKLNYKFSHRRKGDSPSVVASNKKAKQLLDWSPKKDIKQMIESTLKAYNS